MTNRLKLGAVRHKGVNRGKGRFTDTLIVVVFKRIGGDRGGAERNPSADHTNGGGQVGKGADRTAVVSRRANSLGGIGIATAGLILGYIALVKSRLARYRVNRLPFIRTKLNFPRCHIFFQVGKR